MTKMTLLTRRTSKKLILAMQVPGFLDAVPQFGSFTVSERVQNVGFALHKDKSAPEVRVTLTLAWLYLLACISVARLAVRIG